MVSQSASEPEFLSVAQVARRLGCSVSLVQKWRRLGWLPATRLGPADVPVYGYRPADVDRFASERWNRQRGRPAARAAERPGTPRPPGSPPARHPAQQESSPASTSPPPPARPADQPASTGRPATGPERFKPAQLEPVTPENAPGGPPGDAGEAGDQRAPGDRLPAPPAAQPGHGSAPQPPAAAQPSSGSDPELPTPTGKALVLWDADPREGTALVLARFPASDLQTALNLAGRWARRYDQLVLGEPARADDPPAVLARWRRGDRVPV